MKHSLLPHQATPLQVLLTVRTMVKIAKRVLGSVWPTVVGLCPGTSETAKSCKFRRWTTAERVFHPVRRHPHQRRATKMDNSMARIKVTGERSVWQCWYPLPRSAANISTKVQSDTEKAETEVWDNLGWNSCLQRQNKQCLGDCVNTHRHTHTYIYGSRKFVLCYIACYVTNR